MMYFDLLVMSEYNGVGHSHFAMGWKTAEKVQLVSLQMRDGKRSFF